MKKFNFKYALIMVSVLLISSCSVNDDADTPQNSFISLNIDGLEDLGADFLYEGWIIVDGVPVSTGTFSVNSNGDLSQSSFELDATTLASATSFVLSIEPNPDPSPDPADTKLFIGDFNGNSASLGTGTVATSFDMIEGKFIVAAPTGTGAEEEKYSGIWFLDNSTGNAVNGLELPVLEPGWKYEGWVVMDGIPVTTGTFTSVTGSDDASPFSGTNPGPPFPGEDFLVNAPDGLMFPTDIRGKIAVISIEPYPDNSTAPFVLKPLAGMIPTDTMGVQEIGSNVSGSFPTGTVTR